MLEQLLNPTVFSLIFFWTIFWKLFSLWHAARQGHRIWFVALLVINTLGILDIIYLVFFGRDKGKPFTHVFTDVFKGSDTKTPVVKNETLAETTNSSSEKTAV